jgi:hypothetical protein
VGRVELADNTSSEQKNRTHTDAHTPNTLIEVLSGKVLTGARLLAPGASGRRAHANAGGGRVVGLVGRHERDRGEEEGGGH